MSKQETLTDIITEMRGYADTPPPHRAWLDLADRIEAAAKRAEADAIATGAMVAHGKNQRQIAELRECLASAVYDKCNECKHRRVAVGCTNRRGECYVQRWRDALGYDGAQEGEEMADKGKVI